MPTFFIFFFLHFSLVSSTFQFVVTWNGLQSSVLYLLGFRFEADIPISDEDELAKDEAKEELELEAEVVKLLLSILIPPDKTVE